MKLNDIIPRDPVRNNNVPVLYQRMNDLSNWIISPPDTWDIADSYAGIIGTFCKSIMYYDFN